MYFIFRLVIDVVLMIIYVCTSFLLPTSFFLHLFFLTVVYYWLLQIVGFGIGFILRGRTFKFKFINLDASRGLTSNAAEEPAA